MHTIFETDSFVLKSQGSGEANKQLDLFTRDFGLIRATAQGLRYIKSKLRYSLTDFSFVRVSLVRGKEFWRITTASKIDDVKHESLLRVFALLRRLLQGEDTHPELFELIEKAFETLKNEPSAEVEELTVLRILYLLGYVKDDIELRDFVEGAEYDKEIVEKAVGARKKIIIEINRALTASNL